MIYVAGLVGIQDITSNSSILAYLMYTPTMSIRKLTRDSNITPDFSEPGTRVAHPRYQEGQQVRYKNVGGHNPNPASNLFLLTPTDHEAFSIGTIRMVLRDVVPPVGPEEVRYEVYLDFPYPLIISDEDYCRLRMSKRT